MRIALKRSKEHGQMGNDSCLKGRRDELKQTNHLIRFNSLGHRPLKDKWTKPYEFSVNETSLLS